MKKCPYCAEKIQNEAIVCRYCGRNLPQPQEIANAGVSPESVKTNIPKQSAWRQGAKASAVITALYFINNAFIKPPGNDNFQGNMIFGTVSSFLAYWLICAGIVWAWRRFSDNTIARAAFVAVIILGLFLLIATPSGFNTPLFTATPTRTPFPTKTLIPKTPKVSIWPGRATSAASNCIESSQSSGLFQILSKGFLELACVYGTVTHGAPVSGENNKIYFKYHLSNDSTGFYISIESEYYLDNHLSIGVGDCMRAISILGRTGTGEFKMTFPSVEAAVHADLNEPYEGIESIQHCIP